MAARRAKEARAVDDIGLAIEDRPNQLRVFVRVVFEVGVLDDHHVAGGFADAAPHRGALALVVRLKQDADAVTAVEFLEDLPGPILGPIVDDYQLLLDGAEIDLENAGDDGPDGGLLVVSRHHDTELHAAVKVYKKTAGVQGPPPFPS